MKISDIITPVNCQYGAPMGRASIGKYPTTITSGPNCRIVKKNQTKVYKKRVRLDSGGYDSGGAYWGLGAPLYVEFTKDLSYVHYYRLD